MFKSMFEPAEAEVARLAAAPVGSLNHALSLLPVNISGPIEDRLIELPDTTVAGETHRPIVVVPYLASPPAKSDEPVDLPFRRHEGWWYCIVVASADDRYPVGGHRISVPTAQLVRGNIRTLNLVPANAT